MLNKRSLQKDVNVSPSQKVFRSGKRYAKIINGVRVFEITNFLELCCFYILAWIYKISVRKQVKNVTGR